MYRHLLVPLDGSDLSIETVSRAVNLARTLGARVSFLHVHDRDNESLKPASSTEFAQAYQDRARALLTKAEAAARALGVPCDSSIRVDDVPHEAILDAARKAGCDLIFMASHSCQASMDMPLGSQTLKVLTTTELPVLVSSTRNVDHTHPVVGVIRDQHRSLTAVLRAWLHLFDHGDREGTAPDVDLMKAMAHYIAEFPLARDQPKEYDYLFLVLRGRTAMVHAELDELERQHERERVMAEALGGMVERYNQGQATLAELRGAVENYARFTWEHMGRVEGVILPAARRYLTEADWNEIQSAAILPGDSRASDEQQAADRQLFSRIAHLAAS
jgi:nucleotide-binding universal stress UspA family protein/hemerythrin-like domain-containing protein